MSYILDALQRADAERARGGVPTLHARPIVNTAPLGRLGAPQRIGLFIAVVMLVLGVAAAAWWMLQPASSPAPPTTPAAVMPAAAMPIAPTPQPVAMPAAPVAQPAPADAPYAMAVLPAPTPVASKGKSTAGATAAPTPAPTPTLAPLLSELPEAMRRQIPSMAIAGAVDSNNPAQRLLLVNGQVLNQGSQVATDLMLVEINSHNSEFNFRGTRFRMAY